LQALDILPDRQPYHKSPWNYPGVEGQGWTAGDYPPYTIDWVLVTFLTDVARDRKVGQTAALLMEDGSLYFPSGSVPIVGRADSLYVGIEHRNHIAVLSPQPVKITNDQLSFDFRMNDSYRTSTSFGQKQLSDGTWCMFAGDCYKDEDGYDINGLDKAIWSSNNGVFRKYISSDFNLDGDISGPDKAIWFKNNGINSVVPK